jgi:hypothetical protein
MKSVHWIELGDNTVSFRNPAYTIVVGEGFVTTEPTNYYKYPYNNRKSLRKIGTHPASISTVDIGFNCIENTLVCDSFCTQFWDGYMLNVKPKNLSERKVGDYLFKFDGELKCARLLRCQLDVLTDRNSDYYYIDGGFIMRMAEHRMDRKAAKLNISVEDYKTTLLTSNDFRNLLVFHPIAQVFQ